MAKELIVAGITYPWPEDGAVDWGQDLFNWSEAVSNQLEIINTRLIPAGGTSGQVLAKADNSNFNAR